MSSAAITPIVLLPGMDGTGELLKDLAARLASHRPVQLIAYPTDRSLSYAELAAYVAQRVPDRRFVILGESFSGPIAIDIAATDARVAGLILASSFARHPFPSRLAALAGLLDVRWLPKRLVAAALLGPKAARDLSARLHQVLAAVPRNILQDRAREALRTDKRDRLREVACPVMCLQGRLDRLVNRRQVNEILAVQPNCQARWHDAPHMLLATHPDAAVAAINDFCEPMDQSASA